jgi:hypothetical protein
MRLRFLFCFFLLCAGLIQAQEDWSRKEFITALREDVQDNVYPKHKRAGNQFIRYFNGASFDEGQEEYIYRLVNILRKKRFNDAEDFFQLFRLLNHYGAGELNTESLDNFLASSVDYVPSLKHKSAKAYVNYCTNALVDSILHVGQTFQWKLAEGDIFFTYDSVPKISSDYIKLYCASPVDTIAVEMTRGYVDLLGHKWFGRGGRCDWTKHNIPEDSIWVELKDYQVDFRKNYFEASKAELLGRLDHDEDYLLGRYFDGLSANPNRKGAIYPGFISIKDSLQFYNLFTDIDAMGSLEIRGKRMFLFGKSDQDIQLTFYEDDLPFIKAKAKRFRMEDSRIYAQDVKVHLSWNEDSIVHPQLKLLYTDSTQSLSLERIKQNIGYSPIRSSYHKLDCYFDRMEWKKDSTALYFSNDKDPSRNPALLESYNFYNESRYQDIATMAKRHPAFILRTMSRDFKGRKNFSIREIAKYYSYSVVDAQTLMTDFAILGFVDFNQDKQNVKLNDKLFHFLEARLGDRDYDGLRMVSRSDAKPYAKMDLESGDLNVWGVNMVELSDSNKVAVFPYDGEIIVHENRDFTYDGILQTGHFGLFGKKMDFVYDPFVVELNKIDSLQYSIPSGFVDEQGFPVDWKVKTVISDIVGKLYIDGAKNKSGLADKPDFPKLHSYEDSYIYYDRIKNGVYKKDIFSFKADPFELDSLLIINTESLEFPGNLNAPTIFPFFRDTMRLNEDLELSFTHDIKNRYPAYEGRGAFTTKLYLNNKGLSGEGTIYYLNSVTSTDSIFFYPYRALAHADFHHISEQSTPTDCPVVKVEDASIDWRAFDDQMQSWNRDYFYTAYQENYEFDGSMVLSPKVLTASGELYYDEAISVSKEFILQSRDFTADHSQFILFDEVGGIKIVMGKELYSAMSFEDDFGSFETLTDSARFELRKNKYHLYFELMEWDRANQSMIFSQFSDENAWLVSVDKYQDSLQFYATDANYDLTTYELDVDGVSEILMPPVTIEPDSAHIRILSDGKMERLHNAYMWVDTQTITEYDFYDAELDVHSGGRFTGSATFDYIDLEGNYQPIHFSSIEKKGDVVTGVAYITEEDNFHLDPYFGFKGKVLLDSSKDFLTFDGYTRIHLACDNLNRAWIPFKDEVDPEDVFIDLNPDVRLTDRQQWHAGIMMSHGPTVCYPAFLSSPKRVNDYEVLGVNGFVHFDEDEWVYVVGSEEKIADRNAPGNIAVYNPEECTLYTEGELNIGVDAGLVEMQAFGTLFSDFTSQTIAGKLDLSLDFLMHRKAAKMISKSLKKSMLVEKVDESSSLHQRLLEEQIGRRELKKYNRKKEKGRRFLPDEFKHTFYFPQLRFEWNAKSASFISPYKIPLNNIMGRKVDRMVPGVVEVRPHALGDEVNIYIQISSDHFYFITYRRGVMHITSSDKTFNQLIATSPVRLSSRRGTSETGSFRYELGSLKQMQKFLNRVGWE